MDAYIYDAIRTPRGRGKADGALHGVTPLKLSSLLLKTLQERYSCASLVDDVIWGIVDPIGDQGGDLPRIAVLYANYPETVTGVQVNRFCASGLEAVNMAAAKVMAGQSDLVIAGGVECMSRIPMMASGGPWPVDPSIALKSYFVPQGISADLIATKYGYSREQVDAYAVESQKRAALAWKEGYFKRSVVPVMNELGQVLLNRDEHVREETTLESLSQLKPSFEVLGKEAGYDGVAIARYPELSRINHVHHAGNSSGVVDGAAAVLIGNKSVGEALSLKPRARIKAFTSVGSEPCIMLTAPPIATRKVLKRAGLQLSDIDLFEVNEAFAAVILYYLNELALSSERVNVNGGAIAMGHPLGATGALLVGAALDELERRSLTLGLVTLCVGAGMSTATLVERV